MQFNPVDFKRGTQSVFLVRVELIIRLVCVCYYSSKRGCKCVQSWKEINKRYYLSSASPDIFIAYILVTYLGLEHNSQETAH